jgi:nucleotide-binding universal stress UspA family protein
MRSIIIVGYDRTPSSERALLEAGREAAWRGATVKVVHAVHRFPAVPSMSYIPLDLEESVSYAASEMAAFGAGNLRSRYPGLTVESEAVAGAPHEVLTAAARNADLLVLGSRGRGGFTELLLGSVALRTLAHSICPTMVVRAGERESRDTVLVAVDIEDAGDAMLNFAFAEATARSAHLHVLSVQDMGWARAYTGDTEESRSLSAQAVTDAEKRLDQVLYQWRAQYPEVQVDTEVIDGNPGAVLVDAARRADMVVVGAHRHGGGRPGVRLGPIAHTLLHHADCPVVVVPRA